MALIDQIKYIKSQISIAQEDFNFFSCQFDWTCEKIRRKQADLARTRGILSKLGTDLNELSFKLQDAEWKLAQEKAEEDAYNADPMFIEDEWSDIDDSQISSRKHKKIDTSRNDRAKTASKQSKPKPFTKVEKELRAKKKTARGGI